MVSNAVSNAGGGDRAPEWPPTEYLRSRDFSCGHSPPSSQQNIQIFSPPHTALVCSAPAHCYHPPDDMSTLPENGTNGGASRPRVNARYPTSPSVLTVNGHFAPISGEPATQEQYEHGVQVIDEDKQFK